MINVADAIMGSGKTSAAINYINSHPEKRFFYVTPFLSETERIQRSCPDAHFICPKSAYFSHFSKVKHTENLIGDGANISTTHQAFRSYPREMITAIQEKGYTLILDECINILEEAEIDREDMRLLENQGFITRSENGLFSPTEKEYNGRIFKEFLNILSTRDLMTIKNKENLCCKFWVLPPNLIRAFEDVFVLTYMFESQNLYYLFSMYDIPYRKIGIKKENGTFSFTDGEGTIPDYVYHIRDKLHVYHNINANVVGNDKTALSEAWVEKYPEKVKCVQRCVYNFFNNYNKGSKPYERLWSSVGSAKGKLQGKGYAKNFLAFNACAVNEYSRAKYLAYLANVYMNVGHRLFFIKSGVKVDDDSFALSTMVQWIWRSAIRNGEEVYVYIPSRRMRDLLENWMEQLESLNPDQDEFIERNIAYYKSKEKDRKKYYVKASDIAYYSGEDEKLSSIYKDCMRQDKEIRDKIDKMVKDLEARRVKIPLDRYNRDETVVTGGK